MTDIRVNSLAIPLIPSLVHMLDYQRIGEVAGRSLFPCLLQVDAVASVWLCSPLGPRKTPYIYARVRVSPATYPLTPFSIPPVKPCRRRRHFSPQTRMNRFRVPQPSDTQPREPSRRNGFCLNSLYLRAPSPCQLTAGHRRLGSCFPTAGSRHVKLPPFSMHSEQMPPQFLGARRTIGDVHRPDLVRTVDLQPAQKIGIDLVPQRGFRRVWPTIDRLDAHALHQRGDVAAADLDALAVQKVAQHPAARERVFQMQFINAAHEHQILGRHRPGLVVDAAATDVQNLGLSDDGKIVGAVDHRFALSMPALMSAPAKNRSPAPALRSWHEAPSNPPAVERSRRRRRKARP